MTDEAMALKEVPQRLDPRSPRKRKFESGRASLIVIYDYPNGDHITGIELIITDVPDNRGNKRDIYISSDDYYKKFVVCPAERTTKGLVRGPSAGHMYLNKEKVLDLVKRCTATLEDNIIDFVVDRIQKHMY
jgi:hypothetical protein